MAQLSPGVHQKSPRPRPCSAIKKSTKTWDRVQFVLALAITGSFLAFLIMSPSSKPATEATAGTAPTRSRCGRPVRISSMFSRATVFEKKLHVLRRSPNEQDRRAPGESHRDGDCQSASESHQEGQGKGPENEWQFHDSDTLTNFTEWQKARHDIEFNQKRLDHGSQTRQSQGGLPPGSGRPRQELRPERKRTAGPSEAQGGDG